MEPKAIAANDTGIFNTRDRTDRTPRGRMESRFAFLDRVDQPYWGRVRGLLEDWISRYPAGPDRNDLIQRLRSPDDNTHMAAFWELYLHESLLRDGWTVTPHQALPGTSGQPDYHARRGADALLVEATTICRDTREMAEHRRVQQVLAKVDAIPSPDFYLGVDYKRIGPNPLSTKKLKHDLTEWLSTLDVGKLRAAVRTGGIEYRTALQQKDFRPGPGWLLSFTAHPVREGVIRQPGARTVGMEGPGEAVLVDNVGPLQKCLKQKAKKYGTITLPYVIGVLDLSEYPADDEDYARALYGTLTSRLDRSARREQPFRASDGFWSRGRASASSVSAVLTTGGLLPSTVPTAAPVLWQNPTPRATLPSLPWQSRTLTTDGVGVVSPTAGRDPREFFGLSPEWPGPEPPFVR